MRHIVVQNRQPFRHSFAVPPPSSHLPALRRAGIPFGLLAASAPSRLSARWRSVGLLATSAPSRLSARWRSVRLFGCAKRSNSSRFATFGKPKRSNSSRFATYGKPKRSNSSRFATYGKPKRSNSRFAPLTLRAHRGGIRARCLSWLPCEGELAPRRPEGLPLQTLSRQVLYPSPRSDIMFG